MPTCEYSILTAPVIINPKTAGPLSERVFHILWSANQEVYFWCRCVERLFAVMSGRRRYRRPLCRRVFVWRDRLLWTRRTAAAAVQDLQHHILPVQVWLTFTNNISIKLTTDYNDPYYYTIRLSITIQRFNAIASKRAFFILHPPVSPMQVFLAWALVTGIME